MDQVSNGSSLRYGQGPVLIGLRRAHLKKNVNIIFTAQDATGEFEA